MYQHRSINLNLPPHEVLVVVGQNGTAVVAVPLSERVEAIDVVGCGADH